MEEGEGEEGDRRMEREKTEVGWVGGVGGGTFKAFPDDSSPEFNMASMRSTKSGTSANTVSKCGQLLACPVRLARIRSVAAILQKISKGRGVEDRNHTLHEVDYKFYSQILYSSPR